MVNKTNRRSGNKKTAISMKSGSGSWGKSSTYRRSNTGQQTSYGYASAGRTKSHPVPRGYSQINNTFACKVQSFRTLWDQTKGAVSKTRPTPTTLKSFANWINKGANVWHVSNTQVNKWCKTSQKFTTNVSVKTALCNKFGKSTIKAVCCAKSGGYIVATAPTYKGKSFNFPC